MRSRSGSPEAWYFFAIETTSRRLDCTNSRCASSPFFAARRSCWRRAVVSLAVGVELGERGSALLDRLGETDLVVLGEQVVLADVGQVETYEVLVVPLDAVLGHEVRAP